MAQEHFKTSQPRKPAMHCSMRMLALSKKKRDISAAAFAHGEAISFYRLPLSARRIMPGPESLLSIEAMLLFLVGEWGSSIFQQAYVSLQQSLENLSKAPGPGDLVH